jgi:hypothetical protein
VKASATASRHWKTSTPPGPMPKPPVGRPACSSRTRLAQSGQEHQRSTRPVHLVAELDTVHAGQRHPGTVPGAMGQAIATSPGPPRGSFIPHGIRAKPGRSNRRAERRLGRRYARPLNRANVERGASRPEPTPARISLDQDQAPKHLRKCCASSEATVSRVKRSLTERAELCRAPTFYGSRSRPER